MCNNGKEIKGEFTENNSELNDNYHIKNIPHLKVVHGQVVIDEKDPAQVKWFKEFIKK